MIFHQQQNSGGRYNYNAFIYDHESFEMHFHKNYELTYALEGEIECVIDNKPYTLKKGEFGLCLPYCIHSLKPKKNSRYFVIVFSEDFVHTFSKNVSGLKALGFKFKCEKSIEEFILNNLINTTEISIYLMKSCLYAVCNEFKRSTEFIENKETRVIDKICTFIENNHTEDISLNDLAKLLGYDYNYVSRYFRSIFNMTFIDFLNIYRLQTALTLLENDDKSIIDVAFESGFKSVRNFNHCFKKMMGMSPTQYKTASRK